MSEELPAFYFRIKENGAQVFRIDPQIRDRRMELEQIASVNVANGKIRPHGSFELTDDDRAAIEGWVAERRAVLAGRDGEEMARLAERLGHAAHWAQSRASDEQLVRLTDELLLAMHDLRTILVRKKAERFQQGRCR